jgi:hypothetical protein
VQAFSVLPTVKPAGALDPRRRRVERVDEVGVQAAALQAAGGMR